MGEGTLRQASDAGFSLRGALRGEECGSGLRAAASRTEASGIGLEDGRRGYRLSESIDGLSDSEGMEPGLSVAAESGS